MRKDVGLIIEFENGEITEKDKIETFNSIMDFLIDEIANGNAKQTIKRLKAFACLPIKILCFCHAKTSPRDKWGACPW